MGGRTSRWEVADGAPHGLGMAVHSVGWLFTEGCGRVLLVVARNGPVSATVLAGCRCVVVVKTSTLPTEEPRGADVEAVRRPGRGATSGPVGPSGRSCVSAVNPGRPELPPS